MRTLLAIAVLVLSVASVPSARAPILKSTAPLNLKLNSVTVSEAFGAIERVSGITIRIAEGVPAETLRREEVNLTFKGADVIQAIDVIARLSNLAATVADENTVVIQLRAR
jgi:hypothetical protein